MECCYFSACFGRWALLAKEISAPDGHCGHRSQRSGELHLNVKNWGQREMCSVRREGLSSHFCPPAPLGTLSSRSAMTFGL